MKKISVFLLLVFVASFCYGQRFIPMPIPIHMGSGGGLKENAPLAIYLSMTTLTLLIMTARMFFIKNHKDFKKQSIIKNFFFDIDEYEYSKPWINIGTIMLLCVNAIAAMVLLVMFFMKILG